MKSSKIILICYSYNWDDCFWLDEDALPEPDIYTYETDDLELVLKNIEEEGLTEKYEQIEVCIVERTIKSKIVKPEAKKDLNKLSMESWLEQLKELQERK